MNIFVTYMVSTDGSHEPDDALCCADLYSTLEAAKAGVERDRRDISSLSLSQEEVECVDDLDWNVGNDGALYAVDEQCDISYCIREQKIY